MHLFGRAKKNDPPPAQPTESAGPTKKVNAHESILKLKEAMETVERREEHLLRKVDTEIKNAKDFSQQGKKREALQCLKRKKLYDSQVASLDGQKQNLLAQMLALEQMNMNQEVIAQQQRAARDMQAMTAAMGGVEGVEKTYEDIEDGMVEANEIQETMGRAIDVPGVEGLDDDELLAELEGLQEEDLTAELSKVDLSAGIAAPSAPTSQPLPAAPTSAVTKAEEDELAELERSMAM